MTDERLIEDDDDEELIPVETPPEDTPEEEPEVDDEDDDEEDTRLVEDPDEDPDGDTNPNRKKRLKRRQIQKIAKENAQRELRLLREQNEAMARRLAAVEGNALSQNELALDNKLNEARAQIRQAEMIMARAVEAGNGDDVATALNMRDEATAQVAQLEWSKRQVAEARAQPAPTNEASVSLAREWMEANPWYDPQGKNEDSAITNAIDARLVAEGYNPSTVEYWQELTNRVKARVAPAPRRETKANRDMDDDVKSLKKKAPPMGATREHAPQSTKREVYVTPERKQAMMEAGIWEDPVRRNQMLKAYQAYDRNSAR